MSSASGINNMTNRRVVFNDPVSGDLQIICPSSRRVLELIAEGMTEDDAVDFLADKVIPTNATNRNMVNLKDIPLRLNTAETLNRRDAFEWDNIAKKVKVNPGKVKPL